VTRLRSQISELRRRAESRLEGRPAPARAVAEDPRRLVHELEVHRVELELQNEELRAARFETETALERYTDLFDFAPVGYLVVTADGTITKANFAAARLLGQERSRVVGRRFGGFVAEDHAPVFERFLAGAFAADGDGPEPREISIRGGAGGERTVRVTIGIVSGPVPSALLAVEDETVRRQAEEALREEGRRKDEFLGALSHELRNPLSPLRNAVYLLEHAAPGGDVAHNALRIMDRQLGHLTAIIEDLLDVTRIARGKLRLSCEALDLVELVRRTMDDHRAIFQARGIALEGDLPAEPCCVSGDATRLVQILGNLLGNAQKFTPTGGRVKVAVRSEGPVVVLSVRDSGVGVAPEIRARIFEPFTQAPQSLARAPGGLGLGLATVKGLVELHGGTVSLASEGQGRGSEFTIRLPRVSEPSRAVAPVLPSAPGRRRILLIEDNEDGCSTLKELLELSGHEVHTAPDGPTGLAAAREHRPEIVICDIGLPGMDGYQVARALRADAATHGAFLVALTGYARPDDARRAAEAGFDRHMGKPPSAEKLERVFGEAGSGADAR